MLRRVPSFAVLRASLLTPAQKAAGAENAAVPPALLGSLSPLLAVEETLRATLLGQRRLLALHLTRRRVLLGWCGFIQGRGFIDGRGLGRGRLGSGWCTGVWSLRRCDGRHGGGRRLDLRLRGLQLGDLRVDLLRRGSGGGLRLDVLRRG